MMSRCLKGRVAQDQQPMTYCGKRSAAKNHWHHLLQVSLDQAEQPACDALPERPRQLPSIWQCMTARCSALSATRQCQPA